MWLHPGEADMQLRRLNFLESINIAIDVASALLYLHRHCQISVVDFDPKPSNVLLDNYLIAHVSEYGLVRLFSKSGKEAFLNEFSSVGVEGTIGYAAPGNITRLHSFTDVFHHKNNLKLFKTIFRRI